VRIAARIQELLGGIAADLLLPDEMAVRGNSTWQSAFLEYFENTGKLLGSFDSRLAVSG
jgi:hypothetical protein